MLGSVNSQQIFIHILISPWKCFLKCEPQSENFTRFTSPSKWFWCGHIPGFAQQSKNATANEKLVSIQYFVLEQYFRQ